ncbi:MAG: tRNA (adenosine(37)-N6)-dimethylallyltransferase MiaA, partial [Chloroflexota bacterium]
IISADSRQIYREMDIGTAKPTPEQRAQAVHHLVDIVAPDEDFPLVHFQRRAFAAVDDIHQRGRLPLLVGGTGQYITALLEGWNIPEVPPNAELRAELEAFAAEHGVEALYQRLLTLDPTAESFVEPRNLRRIVRALEVCLATGEPFSEQRRKTPPPYRVLVYGLTMERERLYQRADQRVDDMMAAGFLDEVRGLLAKGYRRTLPSMSGLGYAQLAAHLLDGVPLDQAVQATKFATHQFIRRQSTWFRGHDHHILWHNVEETSPATLLKAAARWLET